MIRAIYVITLCVFLNGCVTQAIKTTDNLEWDGSKHKVLLMPMDVVLSELTAGGLLEPKAEWTQQAEQNITDAVNAFFRDERSVRVVATDDWVKEAELPVQLVKLHGTVGGSIVRHAYIPQLKLPNKGDTFDWSLGTDAQVLRDRYGADYALFLYVRDSYTSAGRAAVIVVGAILGVGISGGQQVAFASLVDLQSGDIVWFNRLARGAGDLRTPDPAKDTVKLILDKFPE